MLELNLRSYKDLLSEGVTLRNNDKIDEAEILLLMARKKDINEWQADYELSKLYSIKNELECAIKYCLSSIKKSKTPRISTLDQLASIAMKLNDKAILINGMKSFENYDHQFNKRASILLQAFNFKERNNDLTIENKFKKLKLDKKWLNKNELINSIKEAYYESKPFCFVRLGDGEGTWLFKDISYNVNYYNLSQTNKTEFIKIWFDGLNKEDLISFEKVTYDIKENLHLSDVIGIPPKSWVNHEFQIASIRGMPGTLNIIDLVINQKIESSICSQLMHFELSESKEFYEFIQSLDELNIISCHPGIVDYFKNLGINRVNFIPVPGEPSRKHLHGEGTVSGKHFPDGFKEILDNISDNNLTGKIFLIGAGILGKKYALEVKKQGGIAIDVGSLMDKWMGKKTRPQFK